MLEKNTILLEMSEEAKQLLRKQERLFNEAVNHFLLKWNKTKNKQILTSKWMQEEFKALQSLVPNLSNLEPLLRSKLFRDVGEHYKHAIKTNLSEFDLIPVDRSVTMKFQFHQVKQNGNKITFSFRKEDPFSVCFSATTEHSLSMSGFTTFFNLKRSREKYLLSIYHVQFCRLQQYKPIILKGIQDILSDIASGKGFFHLKNLEEHTKKTLQKRIHTATRADWDIRIYYQQRFASFFVNIPLSWIAQAEKGEQLVFRFYPNLKGSKQVKLQYVDLQPNLRTIQS